MDTDATFGWFKKPAPVTDDTPTRQDIVDAICYMNDTAKALRRKGYTGIHGQPYARLHKAIDGLLYDLQAIDLEARVEA